MAMTRRWFIFKSRIKRNPQDREHLQISFCRVSGYPSIFSKLYESLQNMRILGALEESKRRATALGDDARSRPFAYRLGIQLIGLRV